MRKVTTRMIAAEVGVSHATVSRVLNNDLRVHPETRERVIEAARRNGYRLEPGSGRRTIAIIIHELTFHGYVDNVFSPLLQEISQHGYRAEVIFSSDIKLLETRAVAGAISVSLRDQLNEHWGELSGLPLVRINRQGCHRENIYSVCSDGIAGMKLAVEYLWNNGHRRIAFLSDVTPEVEQLQMSRRHHGFCEAMRRIGDEQPEKSCYFFNLDSTFPDFRKMIGDGITAVIAAGEQRGIRLMHELYRLGIRVPEDLSLLTMENPKISEELIPPHTALAQDFFGLAREALQLLDRLIDRQPVTGDVLVPYHLIERESVRSLL